MGRHVLWGLFQVTSIITVGTDIKDACMMYVKVLKNSRTAL